MPAFGVAPPAQRERRCTVSIPIVALGDAWAAGLWLVAVLLVCVLATIFILGGSVRNALEEASDSQLPSTVRSQAIAWLCRRAARPGAARLRGQVQSLLSDLITHDRNAAVRDAAATGLRTMPGHTVIAADNSVE